MEICLFVIELIATGYTKNRDLILTVDTPKKDFNNVFDINMTEKISTFDLLYFR
jgi:hypothetical protein